jgi:preprotein translocase subunit SecA
MDWDKLQDKVSSAGEALGRLLKRTFGSHTEREVRRLVPLVTRVAELEAWAKGLPAEEFKAHTARWKAELAQRKTDLDSILPEAYALVREASRRTLGLRHFDVQIVGGVVLHEGKIAEMMTGEGKTLVATLPLYLNCLLGRPVYLVTVNDYLARRDCAWMKPIYDYLGVSSGAIQSAMGSWERKPIYACDIVYGTNNEFGFDYLRDNMKTRADDQVQKHLDFAIVDEVDSILIDEARTPLIISGPAEQSSEKYQVADRVARELVRETHFEVKEKERAVSLLEQGIIEAERKIGVESFYTPGNEEWPHFLENALRAHHLYFKDDQYVVEPGEDGSSEVVIVDEFTGRKMAGRRWSDGLHQAVETKEGIPPRQENQTLATITFQNYFRLFKKLAGMTGTALTEANEFHKIYRLDVVTIPTNLAVARADREDVVYRTEKEKWKAIVAEIEEVHGQGQPILVGTTSVEKSELLSKLLGEKKIRHEVLNAKNHEREAAIVAHAGEKRAVTVATNMAGRGTDIKLGGNFEHRLKQALAERTLQEGDPAHFAEIDQVRESLRAQCEKDQAEVLALGGLYVLGSERHEARRIDNQLRGRSGRQGDVGCSRFFLSLQDDLMRRFYRDWVTNAMEKLGMKEGVPIESRMVTRAIERAQRKVEDYNFEIRRNLLEYDDVMDQQRKTIYAVRQDVLEMHELRPKVEKMISSAIERAASSHLGDAEGFRGWWQRTFGFELAEPSAKEAVDKEGSTDAAMSAVLAAYDEREKAFGAELERRIEQYVMLNAIDSRWKDHLYAIDALKTGIGLRGYGQLDPKNEYKREGFALFQNLLAAVEDEVSSLVLRIKVAVQPPSPPAGPAAGGDETGDAQARSDVASAGGGLALRRSATSGGAPPLPAPRGMLAPSGAPARPRGVPLPLGASLAFDVKRRLEMIEKVRAEQRGSAAPAAPESAPGSAPAAAAASVPSAEPARSASPPPRSAPASGSKPARSNEVGRNDACPCGSGKKYKKCHGQA